MKSYYPTATIFPVKIIYIDSTLNDTKFTVTNTIVNQTISNITQQSLVSVLTVPSIQLTDSIYTFECLCNPFKTCLSYGATYAPKAVATLNPFTSRLF